MAKRIERVLTNDPGMGVIRHVDAGYDEAQEFAKKKGVKIPMRRKSEGTSMSCHGRCSKSFIAGP